MIHNQITYTVVDADFDNKNNNITNIYIGHNVSEENVMKILNLNTNYTNIYIENYKIKNIIISHPLANMIISACSNLLEIKLSHVDCLTIKDCNKNMRVYLTTVNKLIIDSSVIKNLIAEVIDDLIIMNNSFVTSHMCIQINNLTLQNLLLKQIIDTSTVKLLDIVNCSNVLKHTAFTNVLDLSLNNSCMSINDLTFPNLKFLYLSNILDLDFNRFKHCNKINEIEIYNCGNISNIPMNLPRKITIHNSVITENN